MYNLTRTGSGSPARIYFCPTCGSTMWADSDLLPGHVSIKSGVLDGDGLEMLKPTMECFAIRKLKWLSEVTNGIDSFEKMPPVSWFPIPGFPRCTPMTSSVYY